MSLGIIDTHAHYDDRRFDEDRDSFIKSLFEDGTVSAVINAGYDLASSKRAVEYTKKYPNFYAWCGIHPQDTGKIEDRERTLFELESLLYNERVVGIGEIGLDYHWPTPERDVQIEWFRLQMELARRTGKPVNIHDRDAHGPCMDVVREFPEVKGIFHSFSGSAEMAKELVKRGWYISFSGVITFKNAARVREAAAAVPLERMMIETDAPYLAPEPMRGKTNDSRNLRYTAAVAAEVKGVSTEEFCAATTRNVREFLKI
ncbi:MAG: TatD family hydrolase [Clostridia bacterium]|nr:TatD family hydrolase [Clostridia bacterium]